jgi:hypothetical protein
MLIPAAVAGAVAEIEDSSRDERPCADEGEREDDSLQLAQLLPPPQIRSELEAAQDGVKSDLLSHAAWFRAATAQRTNLWTLQTAL